jgi:hypothetical protein
MIADSKTRKTPQMRAPLILLACSLAFFYFKQLPILSGDTFALSQSARALVACFENGQFRGCAGTNQFGLPQHVPAMFLAWKGLDDTSIVFILSCLNVLALVVLARIVFKSVAIAPIAKVLIGMTLVIGPIIAYGPYSFGEAISTLAYVGLVVAIFEKKYCRLIFFMLLAVTSRETAFVSIALMTSAILVFDSNRTRRELRQMLLAIYGSMLLGIVCLFSFNVWKFNTWQNLPHMDPVLRTPGLRLKLESAIGIILSPNGGLVPYWFLGAVVALGIPFLGLKNRRLSARKRFSFLLLIAGLVAQVAILSSWYAPYGWVAWGPRLIIPTTAMGATICLVIVFRDEEVLRHLSQFKLLRLPISVLGIVTLIPTVGFLQNPTRTMSWFSGGQSTVCPTPAIIQLDQAYYFKCLIHGSWKMDPSLWYQGLSSFTGLNAILFLVSVMYLVFSITRHLESYGKSCEKEQK